jgi:threonine dehydrogenase-like Zn-dependent dehydrogenase
VYSARVQAVRFEISIPRFLLAQTLGRVSDWFLYGAPSGLGLAELQRQELPGDRWVRLAPIASGICGSDVAMIRFKSSPQFEPFTSFPAVPGHETLARVVEVGKSVEQFKEGDRVVVDPILPCEARGFEPCAWCIKGLPTFCANMGEKGNFARGMLLGANADLPGGWSPEMLAHESQLHRVPEALDDDTAVLCEPLSVGMHAVVRTPLDGVGSVMIIGSGPIAFATIWALRAHGFEGTILAQTKRDGEAKLAKALGATHTVMPADARAAMLETGARAYKPILGPDVFAGGGFPVIFDCVGSADSLAQAIAFAAPRGRIVLLGCAGELKRIDLTFLWGRELEVTGFLGYGRETSGEHTFEITLGKLGEKKSPIAKMITHKFPLDRCAEAVAAAANRAESGALKVVFTNS